MIEHVALLADDFEILLLLSDIEKPDHLVFEGFHQTECLLSRLKIHLGHVSSAWRVLKLVS